MAITVPSPYGNRKTVVRGVVLRQPLEALRLFARDDRGQVLPFFAIVAFFLVKLVFGSYNVGQVIEERIRMQMVADEAAYINSLWQARSLNLMAYMNRAMVSNTVTVAWVTSHKALYEFINSPTTDVTLDLVDAGVAIVLTAIEAITLGIGAIIVEPYRAYYNAAFKGIYRGAMLNGVYRAIATAINTLDTGGALTKGFQVINYLDQMRQMAAYMALMVSMGDTAIEQGIAEKFGMDCSLNANTGIVNRAANIYRYQTIMAGYPWKFSIDKNEYNRYKYAVAHSFDPLATGYAAPMRTTAALLPDVIGLVVKIVSRILCIGLCSVSFGTKFAFGHLSNTTLAMDYFEAQTVFAFVWYFHLKVTLGWCPFCVHPLNKDIDFPFPIPYTAATSKTELWPSANWRFVNYKENKYEFFREPKAMVHVTQTQQQLRNNKHLIPFSGMSGGAELENDLQALGIARAIYCGPMDPNDKPTIWIPGWNARPAMLTGYTAKKNNWLDYDPILGVQAGVSAGTRFGAAQIIREYITLGY